MLFTLKVLLWISLFIIIYSYLLYGVLLWVLVKLNHKTIARDSVSNNQFLPAVTLVVAAYNEEDIIEEKIKNCLELDYPEELLKIVFITDGSTDNTNQIIAKYRQIHLLFQPERKGKIAAINRVMQEIHTPFVIFCDANTLLNVESIRKMVRHYSNPKVGAVSGEKKVVEHGENGSFAGAGEGLYWKYESFLKKLDSDFYTVVGAAGELFSIRTELFEPVPDNVLLDDFIISLKIAAKGYKVVYEREAFALEAPSSNLKEEQKRKIRISAGGFQSIVMLGQLLNIFRFPKLSFQYISHRVLRWAVCPFLLPLIFVLNLLICLKDPSPLYGVLFICQCLFYIAALIGYGFAAKNKKVKLVYVAYYFVFMNVSLYFGLARFLKGKQSVLWDKAERKSKEAQPQIK